MTSLVSLGCFGDSSTPKLALRGHVAINGVPLDEGRIVFVPVDGSGPVAGVEIADGQFSMPRREGLLPELYQVKITSYRATGRKSPRGSGPGGDPNQLVEEIEQYIPPRYNRDSEITVEVRANNQAPLKFDLDVP